jgi:hypothetical protein
MQIMLNILCNAQQLLPFYNIHIINIGCYAITISSRGYQFDHRREYLHSQRTHRKTNNLQAASGLTLWPIL